MAVASLDRAWQTPPTLAGSLTAVNHKVVGKRFIVTGFLFFLAGGIEALLIRLQLAGPERGLIGPQAYNELFTLHGTTMMFLFAVPILEGLGSYFAPLLLGTRDMPFPRLNAFGYWVFLFGGLFVYASFLAGAVPDGGWFAYPPLTGPKFSPGLGLDFWLLGVTLVEISGIVFAVELIVLVLRQRAPGMGISRIPLFVWAMLATAGSMLIAFPTLVAASVMLELDRKLGTSFYDGAAGGSPLLWQHLFWFFGHPEVYIQLLPAIGIVSTIVPVLARARIAAYTLLAWSTLAIALLGFGLWVHHMFAVGIPLLVGAFFGAASFAIAIPSGVQIFGWTATIARGRVLWRTPMLFVAGFVITFVAGGMTGVMVASLPFDLQAHDSFFVVAHFHYVLVGGVVFPIFAALHYWWPKLTGNVLDERLGVATFVLVFAGFNVTFFPQHFVGLLGMPRRVYTFQSGLGWDAWNLVSTAGTVVLALGVLAFLLNAWVARRRPTAAADPWGGNTLEWATASPPASYNFAQLPAVRSRDPLWDEPVAADRWTEPLQEAWAGGREVLVTSGLDARPEGVARIPGPSAWPLVAALGLSIGLVGVLYDRWGLGLVGLAVTTLGLGPWAWSAATWERLEAERPFPPRHPITRPAGWWGALFGSIAALTFFATLLVSTYYLRDAAGAWPPAGIDPPGLAFPVAAGAALAAAALATGHSLLQARRGRLALAALELAGALALATAAVVLQGLALHADGLHPAGLAYASLAVLVPATFAALVAAGAVVQLLALLRSLGGPGLLTLRVAAVYWLFLAATWPVFFVTVYLVPRL